MLYRNKNKKGFALLFAVLISGLLISIGISIFNISIKELMISASIRDSQLAYYAADSAIECFTYWNYTSNAFDYCDDEGGCVDNLGQVKCNDNTPTINREGNSFSSENFFNYSKTPNDIEPMAKMIVEKTKDNVGGVRKIVLELNFLGYNTGESGRRVERNYHRILR